MNYIIVIKKGILKMFFCFSYLFFPSFLFCYSLSPNYFGYTLLRFYVSKPWLWYLLIPLPYHSARVSLAPSSVLACLSRDLHTVRTVFRYMYSIYIYSVCVCIHIHKNTNVHMLCIVFPNDKVVVTFFPFLFLFFFPFLFLQLPISRLLLPILLMQVWKIVFCNRSS